MHGHFVRLLLSVLTHLKANDSTLTECQIWALLIILDDIREALLTYNSKKGAT